MLERDQYRLSEQLALQNLSSPWHAKVHTLETFESLAFPTRLNSLSHARILLDTMHESQFDLFMDELNGLDEADLGMLIRALADYCRFHLAHFSGRKVVFPLSSFLAHLALYRKITGVFDQPRRLLEIGPGCGHFSFFLKQSQSIQEYAQVEVCESFYLLQHMVGAFLFPETFVDLAHPAYGEAVERTLPFTHRTAPPNCEASSFAEIPQSMFSGLRSTHYPWWRLGHLADCENHFDVITSNANLNEMTLEARRVYLDLIGRLLVPEGVLVVQCFGGGDTTINIRGELDEFGFAPLLITRSLHVGDEEITVEDETGLVVSRLGKQFALANGVFISQRHPDYAEQRRRWAVPGPYARMTPGIRRGYLTTSPNRRRFGKDKLIEMILTALSQEKCSA